MDVPILDWVLRPILNVATVWNTGETGDRHWVPRLQSDYKNIETGGSMFDLFYMIPY